MEVNCKTKDTLKFEELTEFQGELKARDENDVKKIVKSIKKHGFDFPFFVWNHDNINHVLDGHGRLKALSYLIAEGEHLPALPVVYIDLKDEAEAKEVLLKLNSQYGHMTAESVQDFIGDLSIDFGDLALPDGLLDLSTLGQEKKTENDDEAPEVEEEAPADSIPGTIYELGPHRLICGDSTDPEVFNKLMAGAKADLVVTDPPYNVNLWDLTPEKAKALHHRQDGKKIKNDKMSDSQFKDFLSKVFDNFKNSLKAGGVFYIWYVDREDINFRAVLKDCGLAVHQCLIWVKNSLIMGFSDWQLRHEPCLYGWKDGSHYWEGRRDLTTVIDDKKNYKKCSKEELIAELERIDGELKTSIIYCDKPPRSDDHPTMKPVKLFSKLIKNSSKEEDVILDPFGGSGTTLIAAARLNRVARLIELDPHYCDVIRKRWTKWAKDNGYDVGSGGLE